MRTTSRKPQNVQTVAHLAEAVAASQGTILTNYRGMTVAEITRLRRKLQTVGAEYHVVKNTLLRRALGDQLTPALEALLQGPTAIVVANEDAVAAAKAILEAFRELRKPEIVVKGALVDGKVLDAEGVVALSKVPPRPVVLGQVVGTLQAPLSNFVGTLNGVLSEFVRTLQAVADKQQPETAQA